MPISFENSSVFIFEYDLDTKFNTLSFSRSVMNKSDQMNGILNILSHLAWVWTRGGDTEDSKKLRNQPFVQSTVFLRIKSVDKPSFYKFTNNEAFNFIHPWHVANIPSVYFQGDVNLPISLGNSSSHATG